MDSIWSLIKEQEERKIHSIVLIIVSNWLPWIVKMMFQAWKMVQRNGWERKEKRSEIDFLEIHRWSSRTAEVQWYVLERLSIRIWPAPSIWPISSSIWLFEWKFSAKAIESDQQTIVAGQVENDGSLQWRVKLLDWRISLSVELCPRRSME